MTRLFLRCRSFVWRRVKIGLAPTSRVGVGDVIVDDLQLARDPLFLADLEAAIEASTARRAE